MEQDLTPQGNCPQCTQRAGLTFTVVIQDGVHVWHDGTTSKTHYWDINCSCGWQSQDWKDLLDEEQTKSAREGLLVKAAGQTADMVKELKEQMEEIRKTSVITIKRDQKLEFIYPPQKPTVVNNITITDSVIFKSKIGTGEE